ncbi:conserved hypothetical protein [Beutenbergia cavernae DSM 12333]|uniref:DUF3137 domain-containing protein n=1 Tax=Beutenbergia cavernae (strain ATCC BAA-8 / DSM 12333 / CCUG 43141 / JCM 11478 / NBRC 16432 / NCIMB 13614 / HKI 0122) TaxID=471853 RepID=C5C4A2_BEUC1|nr:hypothetical protein [Beutenbergia cavernae]ACQ82026.1 conserved hypothetical protein [Beutenbergia cavernae DSM 12333]
MEAGGAFMVLMFLGFGVIVALVLVFSYLSAKKRREALQAWAHSRGWTFTQNVPQLVGRWKGPPFGTGSGRKAYNALTGVVQGRQVVSFGYQYTVQSGKNSTTYQFHVVALSLPVPLSWLQLRPEGFGTSVAKFFGGQDIEFESIAFNERWRVEGPAGKYAYDVVHPRLMERLLWPDALGLNIRIEGSDILVWASGHQDVRQIDRYLVVLDAIVDSIPRFVWQAHGYDPAAR